MSDQVVGQQLVAGLEHAGQGHPQSRGQSAVAVERQPVLVADGTVAARLRMSLPSLFQARDELLAYDLIAHEPPLTQVLSLPPRCQRRRSESGTGLMNMGDILRRAIASTHTDQERSQP